MIKEITFVSSRNEKLRLVTSILFGITLTTSLEGHWCEDVIRILDNNKRGGCEEPEQKVKKQKNGDREYSELRVQNKTVLNTNNIVQLRKYWIRNQRQLPDHQLAVASDKEEHLSEKKYFLLGKHGKHKCLKETEIFYPRW